MPDLVPNLRLVSARIKLKRASDLDGEGRVGEALALYDEILTELAADVGSAVRKRVAEALFFKSQALFDLGEPGEALAVVDELIHRFSTAELPVRRRVLHALWVTCWTLRREYPDHAETALALCNEGVRRFGHETDPCLRERLLGLFVDQSLILEHLGRLEEGIDLRHKVAARYEADPDPNLRERAQRVVDAMDRRFSTKGESF
ncbi:hypothetical protein [Labrys neptuniae]